MAIVTERKKWTKKAQKIYPGRQLRWMYGQLRDFGPHGNDRPQDVPAIPMVLREGGKTKSDYELSPHVVPKRTVASTHGRTVTARGSSGNGQKKFIPLKQIPEMSSAEIAFLRDDCSIFEGYYVPEKRKFVVKKETGARYIGRGSSGRDWELYFGS